MVLCNGQQRAGLPYKGALPATSYLKVVAMNGAVAETLPVTQANQPVNLTIKENGLYIIYLVDNKGVIISTKKIMIGQN
jgi:tRNA splicing ligase